MFSFVFTTLTLTLTIRHPIVCKVKPAKFFRNTKWSHCFFCSWLHFVGYTRTPTYVTHIHPHTPHFAPCRFTCNDPFRFWNMIWCPPKCATVTPIRGRNQRLLFEKSEKNLHFWAHSEYKYLIAVYAIRRDKVNKNAISGVADLIAYRATGGKGLFSRYNTDMI